MKIRREFTEPIDMQSWESYSYKFRVKHVEISRAIDPGEEDELVFTLELIKDAD